MKMRERIRNDRGNFSSSSPAAAVHAPTSTIVCHLPRLLHGLPVSVMLLWTWLVFFSSLAKGADPPFSAPGPRLINLTMPSPSPRTNTPPPPPSSRLHPPPPPPSRLHPPPPSHDNTSFSAPGPIYFSTPSPLDADAAQVYFPSPSDRETNPMIPVIVIGTVITIMVCVLWVTLIVLRVQGVNQPETTFKLYAFLEDITYEKPVTFTSKQLRDYTNNFSTVLGSGGFGKVYLGKLPNGVQCAVKVLQRHLEVKTEEQFKAEVSTIGRTYHANLVRLYGFCYDNSLSALVYEYMRNGSLDKYLFDENSDNHNIQAIGSWERLYGIALGTAKGMAYLHEECQHRIIHYDIKPANILLDDNFSPKVADFGLAKLCNMDQTHVSMTGYRGTPGYSAPEFFLHNFLITYKCDVYSFGMLLFEIFGRRKNVRVGASDTPSLDWFPSSVWDKYEKGELEELTTSCGIEEDQRERAKRLATVALWCVQDCPQERPRMSVVVKMLEGDVEILPPPKPFSFMRSIRTNLINSSMSGTNSTSSQETDSNWYKENTTPNEFECEIQMIEKNI